MKAKVEVFAQTDADAIVKSITGTMEFYDQQERQLKEALRDVDRERAKLRKAVLKSLNGTGAPKRKLTAKARAAFSKAAKKRWAKARKESGK